MAQQTSSIVDRCRTTLQELYDDQHTNNGGQSSRKAPQLLAEFRVLTREKSLTPEILDDKCLRTLVDYSAEGQTEAQKCLSNLILNYAHLREGLVEPYVHCVDKRLKNILTQEETTAKEHHHHHHHQPQQYSNKQNGNEQQHCEVLYYDLRIIFLLSALCPSSRASIRDLLFNLLLKVTLKEAQQFRKENYLLIIESLKTLFNLTMDKCLDHELAAQVIIELFSVVGIQTDSLAVNDDGSKYDHTDQLLVNLIHLLTNMPKEVYLKLSDADVGKVLNHLDEQLKTFTRSTSRDTVLPVLNTCANICRYKEDVRRRWFDQIIGSTKDFEKRPEEYDTLRGRLVKLMTSVDIHIKDIAAEFLHALCGGDTEKFITYTGFGNSAAFLATKGLLSQSARRSSTGADDNDRLENLSSTEQEYQQLRGRLNPITGRLEQPRKDPMEGMSEEEKEWHAHELAGAIVKLSNLGVIKPMQIGSEGEVSELKPMECVDESRSNDIEDSD